MLRTIRVARDPQSVAVVHHYSISPSIGERTYMNKEEAHGDGGEQPQLRNVLLTSL